MAVEFVHGPNFCFSSTPSRVLSIPFQLLSSCGFSFLGCLEFKVGFGLVCFVKQGIVLSVKFVLLFVFSGF